MPNQPRCAVNRRKIPVIGGQRLAGDPYASVEAILPGMGFAAQDDGGCTTH
jgi:hypothetical protein